MTELCEQVDAWQERGPVRLLCQAVQLARGTYYAWRYRQREPRRDRRHQAPGRVPRGYSVTTTGEKVPDGRIQEWLVEILEQDNPTYGYRKLTVVLQRQYHLMINRKKVYRLLKEWHLLWPQRPHKPAHPRQLARNWVVTGPNQLWQTDLKYIYLADEDRFAYLQAVLDVCDRSILAYHLGYQCRAEDAARTLGRAVEARRAEWGAEPPVIRTDNGPQFTSRHWATRCRELGLEPERIPNHTPNMNAYIESWHAQLERECLQRRELPTFATAYQTIGDWITYYNTRRLHGSLDNWAPAQQRQRVANGEAHWMPLRV